MWIEGLERYGYAPGDYSCECSVCHKIFTGNKRAYKMPTDSATKHDDKRAAFIRVMKERGHTPIMDHNVLDIFVYYAYNHNGPGCSTCGWSTCWHCTPDPEKCVPKRCE